MTSRLVRAARGMAVDVSPVRESSDYRLMISGQLVSMIGRQLTIVAVPYQVYLLTGSSFAVGMIGLVQVLPVFAVGLYAGALADRVDRRRLLLVALALEGVTSLLLMLGALHVRTPLAYIYAITAAGAAVQMFEQPTRSAMIPRLVTPRRVPAAMALNQVLFQTGLIVGPALAGLIIAHAGLFWTYAGDAFSYLVALATVFKMGSQPPSNEARPAGLRAPLDALAFIRDKPVLLSIFLIDLDAMIFGMPRAVFPALATTVFHTGPTGLGLLYSSLGVGGLGGALLTGWISRVVHRGRVVIWSVLAWGAAITLFGVTTFHPSWFWIGLLMLALASAADVFSAVFRGTILQLAVPDGWRGRMSALNIMVVTGGPRLGDAETGVVATLSTVQVSVISGGLACIVGAVVLTLAVPALRDYRAARSPDPAAVVS
ncbi:MAG TPA: MFS transporter [Candidatus Dormibacteraeota bacterium]